MKGLVVVVDDDVDFAESAVELLELSGYEAFRVGSRREAIEQCSGRELLAVLIDLRLGRFSGIECCRALREQQHASLRVIFMTGHSSEDVVAEARECRAAGLFAKPLDWDEVLAAIGG